PAARDKPLTRFMPRRTPKLRNCLGSAHNGKALLCAERGSGSLPCCETVRRFEVLPLLFDIERRIVPDMPPAAFGRLNRPLNVSTGDDGSLLWATTDRD